MTPDELAAIRERAEAASKGPWKFPNRNWPGVVTGKFGCLWTSGKHDGRINHEPDAAFIAHAREDVPALLGHADTLQARLDKVRSLHKKVACTDEDGEPIPGDFYACLECKDLDDHSGERVHEVWPCPTIQAIDGSDQ